MSDAHDFNANKIFVLLFLATALEVAWGLWMPGPNWWVWGGLIAMAFYKGFYILQYFMHFRFEGWIVKGLIAPTPLLIIILLAALGPDVMFNDRMDHSITDMANPETGEVEHLDERYEREFAEKAAEGDGH